uniref:Cadherin domain-containing protein n=1 Tax=Anolis carolinensis TaxID=28377 RepID=A0A803T7D6_ANOCA
ASPALLWVVSSGRGLPRPDSVVLTLQPTEGLPPGSIIGSVATAEPVPRGPATYMLVGSSHGAGVFTVDAETGEIYVTQELDYEAGTRHTLQVSVEDAAQGYPSQRLVLVEIHVQDRNDHAPAWPQDPVTVVVSESAAPGFSLFTFQALDKDGPGPNSQLRYSLLRQEAALPPFQLDPRSGELSLQGPLDRETQAAFLLVVPGHGPGPQRQPAPLGSRDGARLRHGRERQRARVPLPRKGRRP